MSDDRRPDGPLAVALARLDQLPSTVRQRGRVTDLVGLVLKATLPGVHLGDQVHVIRAGREPLLAEVVGFSQERTLLMPLGEPDGVGPDSLVESTGRPLSLRCGPALLGRVVDGLGRLLDGGPPLAAPLTDWPVDRPAPSPLERPRIRRPLELGVRAIDGLLTVGEGQRIGLFAGSGVGKSTLLGQIARNTSAEVAVICLVGERGREVREFIEESLGEGLARSVVVCATSDAPPLVRMRSAQVATAIAEHFRDEGRSVLLLMDSVTRYARALREVALAAGEPPARRGFPPSVFARLPRLLERTGTAARGSITAIYTVLVEGGDLEEPVADEVRGILDGHIVLSRELAQRGHWPAIDVLQSLSRVMPAVTDEAHRAAAGKLRRVLATYERQRDLILLGAYTRGSDRETDDALARIEAVLDLLHQRADERPTLEETRRRLLALFA
jgi:ATP synthase in type III secretion protein N